MPPKNKKKVPPAVLGSQGAGASKPSRSNKAKAQDIVLAVDVGALSAPYNRIVGDVIVSVPASATVAEARMRVGTAIAKATSDLLHRAVAPFSAPPRLFLRMSTDENDEEVAPQELEAGTLADAGLEPTEFEYLVIAKPAGLKPMTAAAASPAAPAPAAPSGRTTRAGAATEAGGDKKRGGGGGRRGAAAAAAASPAPTRLRGEAAPGAAKVSHYQAAIAAAEAGRAVGEYAPLPPAKKRKRWSEEEDAALTEGVKIYGVGQWKVIWERMGGLDGPMASRSQVDLKDRWRNINKKAQREAEALE